MSKRSKACDISQKVKEIVWLRDNKSCIFCGRYVPKTCANAHYKKRSQGGLGIPKNIFTACPRCHYEEDFGKNTKEYEKKARQYLQSQYEDWDEKELYYNKYDNKGVRQQ